MTQIDFWQLSRDPAETVVAQIAERTLSAGGRLLVVVSGPEQAERISQALWSRGAESFLAHGDAGTAVDARQPILIALDMIPANGARHVVLADGAWRDPPADTERVFLLFGDGTIAAARERWKLLPPGHRAFWKQGARGWEKVA